MTAPPTDLAVYTSALGRGGAERAMLNLANALVEKRIRVDVVIAKRDESDYLDLLRPEVGVVDIDSSPAVLGLPRFVRYLREAEPAALLSWEPLGHVLLLAARALAGVEATCAASVQNFHSRELGTGLGLYRRLQLKSMEYSLPRMDRVFAVAERVADDLVRHFRVPREMVGVIHNPIVTPEIAEEAAEPVAHPWFADGAPPVVVSVGRLTRQKNYALLLRAFERVRRRIDARLMIMGKGEQRSDLEELAEALGVADDVALPGFVDNPFALMARASVFVLSSDWEGLPSVLIEALAVGCPVVSTDCPSGPREILEDGRYGRLVPTGDPERLAEAVVETIDTETDRERLEERARDFSSEAVAGSYIEQLLEGGELCS